MGKFDHENQQIDPRLEPYRRYINILKRMKSVLDTTADSELVKWFQDKCPRYSLKTNQIIEDKQKKAENDEDFLLIEMSLFYSHLDKTIKEGEEILSQPYDSDTELSKIESLDKDIKWYVDLSKSVFENQKKDDYALCNSGNQAARIAEKLATAVMTIEVLNNEQNSLQRLEQVEDACIDLDNARLRYNTAFNRMFENLASDKATLKVLAELDPNLPLSKTYDSYKEAYGKKKTIYEKLHDDFKRNEDKRIKLNQEMDSINYHFRELGDKKQNLQWNLRDLDNREQNLSIKIKELDQTLKTEKRQFDIQKNTITNELSETKNFLEDKTKVYKFYQNAHVETFTKKNYEADRQKLLNTVIAKGSLFTKDYTLCNFVEDNEKYKSIRSKQISIEKKIADSKEDKELLKSLEAEKKEQETVLVKLQNEINENIHRNAKTDDEVKAVNKNITALRQQLDNLDDAIAISKSKKRYDEATLVAFRSSLGKEVEDNQIKVQKLKEALKNTEKSEKSRLSALEKEIADAKAAIKKVQNDRISMQKKLGNVENTIKEYGEQFDNLKKSEQDLLKESEPLQKAKAEADAALNLMSGVSKIDQTLKYVDKPGEDLEQAMHTFTGKIARRDGAIDPKQFYSNSITYIYKNAATLKTKLVSYTKLTNFYNSGTFNGMERALNTLISDLEKEGTDIPKIREDLTTLQLKSEAYIIAKNQQNLYFFSPSRQRLNRLSAANDLLNFAKTVNTTFEFGPQPEKIEKVTKLAEKCDKLLKKVPDKKALELHTLKEFKKAGMHYSELLAKGNDQRTDLLNAENQMKFDPFVLN